MTKRIAVAMFEAGFAQQQPAALYSPNSVDVLLTLLGMWRANAKWIPVNTRNAIDANAAYLNYVRCEWLFYHSSLAGDVAALKAKVPGLKHCVCLDGPHDGDPGMADFIADARRRANGRIRATRSAIWTRSSASSRPAARPAPPRASTSPISAGGR